MNRQFDFERLVELCRRTHEETRRSAARAIDRSLVVRNWLFGWYIVEFEGGGSARRELYGKELIARLAAKLKATGIKGSSPTNLRKCREFYQVFAEIQQTVSVESGKHSEIRQTLSVESFTPRLDIASATLTDLAERFPLGWSHYVNLLSVTNPDARRFYEIEAADNGWSVRELRRQLDSSLYERLALSRDKHDVLAEQLAMVRREVGGVMGGAMSEGRVGGEGRDPDGAGRLSEMPPGCNPASASGARQPPRFEGDWQEGRLRDIAQLHRDHVVPDTTNDTPYAHFSLPAYDAGKTPKIEPGTAIRSGKFRVPNNAVLVSRLNPRIARVWAPALAESNAVASTEFLVLTPRTTATREFLYFLCSSAQFWERLVLSVTGTTGSHQRVNRNDAMTLAVRFPEGTIEQRAIAAVLSDVDELIGSLEALSAKKRDIKQAAMQQLLTGRTRLPGFGGEWETVTLGAIGDTYGGLAGRRARILAMEELAISRFWMCWRRSFSLDNASIE